MCRNNGCFTDTCSVKRVEGKIITHPLPWLTEIVKLHIHTEYTYIHNDVLYLILSKSIPFSQESRQGIFRLKLQSFLFRQQTLH